MSTPLAISTRDLTKRYRLGGKKPVDRSIRNAFAALLKGDGRSAKGAAKDFWALQGVSLDVRHGENVGLIGMNGAGKSTLLKVLSRITEPTGGSATISGRIGALLEVGTGFSLQLTGRENVFLYGSILGMRQAEVRRKFDAIVEFSGIERHIDTPVKRYSSGMYVRLAFAVAAHLEPEILFLDEVLAVGDLAFQRKCIEFTKDLQRRDATIMFVSHNMFSIKTMCERVVYMRNGRVEYDGSVEGGIELYERDCRLSALSWDGAGAPETWPVFIDRCEVIGDKGESRAMFDVGEFMRIRLEYSVRSPLDSPNFIIAFVRSDGVTCCTYSTELDGIDLGAVDDGGVLELDVPMLRLVAEMYSVHVTVRRKGFQDIVCSQVGATFHVRDDLLSPHFGVFHEPGAWRGDGLPVNARQALERAPQPLASG